jgi:hypothetical protein
MTTQLALLPVPVEACRDLWRGGAARGPWAGTCDDCGRSRDEDGHRLLVARQAHHRLFLCLSCFALRLPKRELLELARRAA